MDIHQISQKEKLPAILVDLDYTVAIHQGRGPFEWDKIYTDKLDERMVPIIKIFIDAGIQVIFLTGRNATLEAQLQTREWLENNFPFYYLDENNVKHYEWDLIMRRENDFRHADISKKEMYEQFVEPFYNVLCSFDDSTKCVKMWRELGLLTFQVNDICA